jgi:hypothetical protein
MHNYLWDSHVELVSSHAPEGLQEFGVVWLSPSSIGDRIDNLEELNSYFLCIVDKLNRSIENENDDEQNSLSIFLDETITDILSEWLEGLSEYRIYPTGDESFDVFPKERIFTIMQKILEKTVRIPGPVELPKFPKEPPAILTVEKPVELPVAKEETIASALRRNRTKKQRPERKNVSTTRNRRKHPSI